MPGTSHAAIACTFASDDAAISGVRLLAAVAVSGSIRVGASDAERSCKLAAECGAMADLDPLDPLRGIGDLATAEDAARSVNRGAVAGGVVGAAVGVAAGFTSIGAVVPVPQGSAPLALALLCFAIGIAIGGVLGGAFGRRPSTHAGFRLIDAMEEGAIAVVAGVEAQKTDEARAALAKAGAEDITIVAGGPRPVV